MAEQVHIFDTTLRDGEQSPGISLNTEEKVEIAQQLARLGVDVIEAGFPITSPGDFEAVEAIARKVEGPVICGLARTHKADIDAAWGAIKDAERPRIHTFISTSDIHITHQLQTTREDVKGQAKAAVTLAKAYADDVEFSPMDATRADVEFTAEVCAIAVAEGATVINIPDTVGYTTPEEYSRYFTRLYELAPELRGVELSVHCHDDLGLAVANSYAGLLAGARQVECAVNGIGERAGNCSLEEIVMLLRTRRDEHGLDTGSIRASSPARAAWSRASPATRCSRTRRSSAATPSPTSPASTRTACSRSGSRTRSWTRATSAWTRTRSCSASTRAATRCATRSSSSASRSRATRSTRRSSSSRRSPTARSRSPASTSRRSSPTACARDRRATSSPGSTSRPRRRRPPTARVAVTMPDGTESEGESGGDGPVDAIFGAIRAATGVESELRQYTVSAVTEGEDALGEVTVMLRAHGRLASGQGVATDILEASARAYVRALSNALEGAAVREAEGVTADAAGEPATPGP